MSYFDNSPVAVASFLTRRQMSVVICVSGGSHIAFHVPVRRHPRLSDNVRCSRTRRAPASALARDG